MLHSQTDLQSKCKMACSICGLSGHNKTTCARQRAKRIAAAVVEYGTSTVVARGLDVVCPGLGLTYEAANITMALLRASRTGSVNEADVFEVLMRLSGSG